MLYHQNQELNLLCALFALDMLHYEINNQETDYFLIRTIQKRVNKMGTDELSYFNAAHRLTKD